MNGSIWCFSFVNGVHKAVVSNSHWVTGGRQAQRAALKGLVCENTLANYVCVCVCVCVLGSGHSQDTDGRNGVSRSMSSGQITPVLCLLGILVGGHKQSLLGLSNWTAGQKMQAAAEQHRNTPAEICSSAVYFSLCVPHEMTTGRGENHLKTASHWTSLTSDFTERFIKVNLGWF